MRTWLRALDELLRGRKTDARDLAENRLDLPLRRYVPLGVALGSSYGFFMGWYAIANRPTGSAMQVLASMVKLPALFFLTLVVTLPSLYVFNALVGSRLSFGACDGAAQEIGAPLAEGSSRNPGVQGHPTGYRFIARGVRPAPRLRDIPPAAHARYASCARSRTRVAPELG